MKYFKVTKRVETIETFYMYADTGEKAKSEVQYGRTQPIDRIGYKEHREITAEDWDDADYKEYTVIGLRNGKIETRHVMAPDKAWADRKADYSDCGDWKLIEVLDGKVEQC